MNIIPDTLVTVAHEDGTQVTREYATFVQSITKEMGSNTHNILHAAVGISGESGELLDAVKKVWVYNKPIDRANIVEELGDLRFYMQALMNELEIGEHEVIQGNVDKIQTRYPIGYTDAAAIARADKVIPEEDFIEFPATFPETEFYVAESLEKANEGTFIAGPFTFFTHVFEVYEKDKNVVVTVTENKVRIIS